MPNSFQKTNEFFKITGTAYCDPGDSLCDGKYAIQGIHPVSYEIATIWKPTGGENKVSSSAQSLEVHAQDNSCWDFTSSAATAETHYDFKKHVVNKLPLKLQLTGHVDMHSFENSVTFQLLKIDGNIVVDNKVWTTEDTLYINEQLEYKVALETEYRIILTAIVSTGDQPGAISNLKVTIV